MDFYLSVATVCGLVIIGAQWLKDWRQRRDAALVLKRGCDAAVRGE